MLRVNLPVLGTMYNTCIPTKKKIVMGVGTKVMGDSKCHKSLQVGKLHVHGHVEQIGTCT